MQKNKQAFTLVELIIVITILAVLATIAFVSFQGYSAQARDGKKVSEIKNLSSKIEIGVSVQAISPTSYVINSTASHPPQLTIMGSTYNSDNSGDPMFDPVPVGYVAGSINSNLVDLEAKKIDSNYKIGAVSLRGRNLYQIVTVTEKDKKPISQGNYVPRGTSTGTLIHSGTLISGKDIKIASNGVGYYQRGDYIYLNPTANYFEVVKVSPDLTQLTLSGVTTPVTGNYELGYYGYPENNYLVNMWDMIPGFYGY